MRHSWIFKQVIISVNSTARVSSYNEMRARNLFRHNSNHIDNNKCLAAPRYFVALTSILYACPRRGKKKKQWQRNNHKQLTRMARLSNQGSFYTSLGRYGQNSEINRGDIDGQVRCAKIKDRHPRHSIKSHSNSNALTVRLCVFSGSSAGAEAFLNLDYYVLRREVHKP